MKFLDRIFGINDRRFKKALLMELDEIELVYNSFYFSHVKSHVIKFIKSGKNSSVIAEVAKDYETGTTEFFHKFIYHTVSAELVSGKYLFLPGILSPIGEGFLYIFDKSADILNTLGAIEFTEVEVERFKALIRNEIRNSYPIEVPYR